MNIGVYQKLLEAITNASEPLSDLHDYSSLLEKIGDARFVLIGEATHGTHEFYQTRIDITRALIENKDFMAVAIEGDWPDAYHINRYIHGAGHKEAWKEALADFKRFPTWMWRNTTLPPFLTWLRSYNDNLPSSSKIGFYGLDLYSMNSSIQAVIEYLAKVDPNAAERARKRYNCFDHLQTDPQTYGYLTSLGVKENCIKEAVEQLMEMQHHALDYVQKNGTVAEDEFFYAAQNARLVKNAEKYYRSMFEGHIQSWNVRDEHMTETLNTLADHLETRFGRPAKIVIWAHNSHIGDARATEMGARGELNIGQLVRDQHELDCYSIGFSTYDGTVTAADDWDCPAKCKRVNPGMEGSYEDLFHHVKLKNFILDLRGNPTLEHYLQFPRLQRAIGVIYRPETERQSHYFFTKLLYQFDSIIHIDTTRAVEPLDSSPEWKS
jgi:erythromycin esterase-like protein